MNGRSYDDFEVFWREVHAPLRAHVARKYGGADADDVVQETMIRCYQNWSVLDPDRDPWPWLTVVARHVAADRARSRARRAQGEPIDLTDEETPEEAVCAGEERSHVLSAFALLPLADRRLIALHHVQGLPTARIAVMTGRSDNAVRQHLYRARRRLANLFRDASGSAGSGAFTTIAVQAGSLGRALFRHADTAPAAACLSAAALLCTGATAAPPVRPVAQVVVVRADTALPAPARPVHAARVPSVTSILPLRRLTRIGGPVKVGDATGHSRRGIKVLLPGSDQEIYFDDERASGVIKGACGPLAELPCENPASVARPGADRQ
jgi:RNA polymerase sigma-70 factor (ECF subfamily)